MKKIARREVLQTLITGSAITVLPIFGTACAQKNSNQNPYARKTEKQLSLLAFIKAKEGMEEQVKNLLMGLLAPTRKEEGCLNYTMHTDPEDKTSFMFYENWASHEIWEKHLQSAHITSFGEKVGELLAEPIQLTKWSLAD